MPQPPPLPLALRLLTESQPTQPAELIRAAQVALQHERADLARGFLQKLLSGGASDEELAPLATKLADVLLQFGTAPDLQPEGQQLLEKVTAAARRQAQDPRRIAERIGQLSAPAASQRAEALLGLADAGPEAIAALVAVLADASRSVEHPAVRWALVTLCASDPWPLVAGLAAPEEGVKMQLLTVLGRIGEASLAPFVIDQAVLPNVPPPRQELARLALTRMGVVQPTRDQARRRIAGQIEALLAGQLPEHFPAGELVPLWHWTSEGKLAFEQRPRQQVVLALAQRLAQALVPLANDPPSRQAAWLLALEVAQRQHGLDQPLDRSALAAAGVELEQAEGAALPQLLRAAVQQGRTGAALACLALLADSGDATWLTAGSGREGESPLGDALRSSDRRVRLAACQVAIKLAPAGSFPGAGLIGNHLGWFAAARGTRRILVGHPRADEGQRLVATLVPMGYEAEVVPGGRMLVERVLPDADCEGVLVADSITQPPVEELVQWLRRDFRTAQLPVVVLASSPRLAPLADFFADDRATAVVPYPYSEAALASLPGELARLAGPTAASPRQRREHAAQALQALTVLSRQPALWQAYGLKSTQPVLIAALHHPPPLATLAAQVLGELGTPAAQRALWELALAKDPPLALRQAAAAALARATSQRGLGLTSSQIAQYRQQLAAASEGAAPADPATAQLHGELMSLLSSGP